MTHKAAMLALVAMLVIGTSAALAVGSVPSAKSNAPLAQETETTTAGNQTTTAVTGTQTANVTF